MKLAILAFLTAACSFAQQKAWNLILNERLPYLGEGNWIVIADSAFPLRSAPGIETIVSNESHINTLRQVFYALSKDAHVRPVIYADLELEHVAEQDFPDVTPYRQLFSSLLEKFFPGAAASTVYHDSMIRRIEEAAKTLNVLIVKTSMAIPYTSVFLELRTGYWADEAEHRLRESLP
jgi:hypothetical protein